MTSDVGNGTTTMTDQGRVAGHDGITDSDWVNSWLDRAERVFGGYVVPIVCLFGIACNALNLAVLTRRQMRTSPYTYLLGLAVTDVSVLTLSVLESAVYKPFGRGVYLWEVYDAFVYYPVSNVFSSSSVWITVLLTTERFWITVLLTIERYISVRYPLKAKELCTRRLARRTIVIIVVWALAINLPRFFCSTVVRSDPPSVDATDTPWNTTLTNWSNGSVGVSGHWEYKRTSTAFESSEFYRRWTWMMIVVVQLIPCVTLLFLNASLIAIVYRANRRRTQLHATGLPSATTAGATATSSAARHSSESVSAVYNSGGLVCHSAEQIRMTVTCISIICLFLICIVPSAFSNRPIAKALFGRGQTMDEFTRGPIFRLLRVVTNMLVYCNLSLNFLLYCVFNQKFLRVLRVTAYRILPPMLRRGHDDGQRYVVGGGAHQLAFNAPRNSGDVGGARRRVSSTASVASTAPTTVGVVRTSVDVTAVGPHAAREHLLVSSAGGDALSTSTFLMSRPRRRGCYEPLRKADGQLSFQFALHEMPRESSGGGGGASTDSADELARSRSRFD